ncbi:RHS repeat-associated core domain-containing protein [Mucilaginibacter glaciei]|uniref:LamG-like jellyroll fold domain-containing protein n=1 Tax=Mucilaginibacter glaciei TaxID=2772109 RepID=A0A926P0J6_9SPHI|nr:RHS repeat-associated core domain-containing protein [Mucilaginibacter glaciei]MBD1395428.1 hypothetical protein [Mucilaginibacter glaciei]
MNLKGVAAAYDPPTTVTLTGPFTGGQSFTVVDDKFNDAAAWAAISGQTSANAISLQVVDAAPITINFTYSVTVKVDYYSTPGQTTPLVKDNQTLTVNYNKDQGTTYSAASTLNFQGAYKMVITILSATSSGSTPPTAGMVQLVGSITPDRKYNFDPAAALTITNTKLIGAASTGQQQLILSWTPPATAGNGAEEYDLEWATLASGDANQDVLDHVTGAYDAYWAGRMGELFRNNATRITTSGQSYTLNVVSNDDYLVARLRQVQYNAGGIRVSGNWQYASGNAFLGWRIYAPGSSGASGNFTWHQADFNWQYAAAFAEQGKKKEVISYFDGTLRGRQTVTINNTDNVPVAQENIYDVFGRQVASILPAPVKNAGTSVPFLHYFQNLNLNAAGNSYSYTDVLGSGTTACEVSPAILSNSSGSSKYYSSSNDFINDSAFPAKKNMNRYIPDAQQYPLSVTQYTPDNTGRVRLQGGVGATFQPAPGTTPSKTTRYFYAKPEQWELDQLFGNDVGYAEHYLKNMVADANNQVSISYVNGSGKTIATALTGGTPSGMDALASQTNVVSQTVHVLKAEQFSYDNSNLTLSANTTYLASAPEQITFAYDMPQLIYRFMQGSTSICSNCYYDLHIKVAGSCGVLKDVTVPIGAKVANATCTGAGDYTNSFTVDLPSVGEYNVTFEYALSKSTIEEYVDRFISEGQSKGVVSKEWFFLKPALTSLDLSGPLNDCKTCLQKLGAQADFTAMVTGKLTASGVDFTQFSTAEIGDYNAWVADKYNMLKTNCQNIVAQCSFADCNDETNAMLADVSPGGQYAMFDGSNQALEPQINVLSNNWRAAFPVLSPTHPLYKAHRFTLPDGTVSSLHSSSTVTADVVKYWKPEWAQYLLSFHPEYCKLQFCISNHPNAEWDERVKQLALRSTDISSITGTTGGFSDSNGAWLMDGDPFFKAGGLGYRYAAQMKADLDNYSKAVLPDVNPGLPVKNLSQFVIYSLYCAPGCDNNSPSNCWTNCIPACRVNDREWDLYKTLYFQLKDKYYKLRRNGADYCGETCPVGQPVAYTTSSCATKNDFSISYTSEADLVPNSCLNGSTPVTITFNGSGVKAATYVFLYYSSGVATANLPSSLIFNTGERKKSMCLPAGIPLSAIQISAVNCSNTPPATSNPSTGPTSPPGGEGTQNSDLIASWQLNGDGQDASIYNNQATMYNVTPVSDRFGHALGALQFDGTSSYLSVADNQDLRLATDFTLNAWVKVDAYSLSNVSTILSKRKESNIQGWLWGINGMSATTPKVVSFGPGGTGVNATGNTVVPLSSVGTKQWHMITAVYTKNTSNLAIYVDGVLDKNTNIATPDGTLVTPLLIGRDAGNPQNGYYFKGAMDDIRMYKIILSASAIQDLYLAPDNYTVKGTDFFISDIAENTQNPTNSAQTGTLLTIKVKPNIMMATRPTMHAMLTYSYPSVGNAGNETAFLPVDISSSTNTGNAFIASPPQNIFGLYITGNVPAATGQSTDNGCGQAYINKTSRFDAISTMNDFPANRAAANAVNDLALQDQVKSNCEGNADRWMAALADGLQSSTAYVGKEGPLRTALINFCANNGDASHPFGASTTTKTGSANPDAPYRSFSDIIKAQLTLTNFTSALNPWLLDGPYPFDVTMQLANTTISQSNTAICSLLNNLNTAYQASPLSNTQSFYQYLVTTYGAAMTLSPAGLTDLQNSCSSCNFVLQNDLDLPVFLVPAAKGCITTAEYTAEKNNLTTVQVPGLSSSDPNYSIILTNFLNQKFGFSLAFSDYTTFESSGLPLLCNQPAYRSVTVSAYAEMESLLAQANYNSKRTYETYLTDQRNTFRLNYINTCSTARGYTDMTINRRNYHFTLYYYDQADNLVRTVPPEGVDLVDASRFDLIDQARVTAATTSTTGPYAGPAANADKTTAFTDLSTVLSAPTGAVEMWLYNSKPGSYHIVEVTPDDKYLFQVSIIGQWLTVDVYPTTKPSATTFKLMPATGHYTANIYGALPLGLYVHLVFQGNNLGAGTNTPQLYLNGTQVFLNSQAVREANQQAGFTIKATSTSVTLPDDLANLKHMRLYTHLLSQAVISANATDLYFNTTDNTSTSWSRFNTPATGAPTTISPTTTVEASNGEYFPGHRLATTYVYNATNQVSQQFSPDGGTNRFWYDMLSRLVISQNDKQTGGANFSYTAYDNLGRISEVGQKNQTTVTLPSPGYLDDTAINNFNGAGTNSQITRTWYDALPAVANGLQNFTQTNLRKRVAATAYADAQAGPCLNATYYSYDIDGNVNTLWQQVNGLGTKKVNYEYDLISGKVNFVAYQPGQNDQFYYKYDYDAENRLTAAWTGTGAMLRPVAGSLLLDGNKRLEAEYFYYLHGPLARVELGPQNGKVQGIDYAYTLQGWLKGVNNQSTAQTTDIGQDRISTGNATIPKDAYAYSLGYYNGDYQPAGTTAALGFNMSYSAQSGDVSGQNLYNGNISNSTLSISQFNSGAPIGYSYRYDQLNRLKKMRQHTGISGAWNGTSATNDYKEDITYDGNGNILTYLRNGAAASSSQSMDNLSYNYARDANGKLTSNKLQYIADAVATSNYANDLRNQTNTTNYRYDAIGNMTYDAQSNITGPSNDLNNGINWSVYGKIQTINNSVTGNIIYQYDAAGNRVSKTAGGLTTYYVRDAQGNTLAVYDNGGSNINWKEQILYGSSRLGTWTPNMVYNAAIPNSDGAISSFIAGKRFYELNNHLGNVLATVTDRRTWSGTSLTPDVASAQDYYPFGMLQPNRQFTQSGTGYTYGFNGKENDNEVKGVGNQVDFGARAYDPRIGRWFSPDKVGKPSYSSYQFSKDSPTNYVDPDGNDEIHFYYYTQQNLDKNGKAYTSISVWSQIIENGQLAHTFFVHPELGKAVQIHPFEAGSNIANQHSFSASRNDLAMASVTKYLYGMAQVHTDDYEYLGKLLLADPSVTRHYANNAAWSRAFSGAELQVSSANFGRKVLNTSETVYGIIDGYNLVKGGVSSVIKAFDAYKGLTTSELVAKAAVKAEISVGGTGRFAGTAKHTYANTLLSRYQSIHGSRGLEFNSYFNNGVGNRGFLDIINNNTKTIFDFKFGDATMGSSQYSKYSRNFPGYTIEIVKPK